MNNHTFWIAAVSFLLGVVVTIIGGAILVAKVLSAAGVTEDDLQ